MSGILGLVLVLVGGAIVTGNVPAALRSVKFMPALVGGLVLVGTVLVIYNLVVAVQEYRKRSETITTNTVVVTPQGAQLITQPVVAAPPVSTPQGVVTVAAPVGTPTVTPLPVFAPSGSDGSRPPSQQTTEDAFKQWLKDNGDPFVIAVPADMPPPPEFKPPVIPPRAPVVPPPTPTGVKETTTVTTQTLPAPVATRPPTTVTTVTTTKPTTTSVPSTVTSQSTSVKPPKAPGAAPTQVTTTTTTVTTPSAPSTTSSGPVVPNDTGSKLSKKEAQEMLDEHNKRRMEIGKSAFTKHLPVPSTPLPLLEWDPVLAKYAQEWSDTMLRDGNMYHSSGKRADGTRYGESIAYNMGMKATPSDKVADWADSESPHYHYETNSCDPNEVCGHFTQVIWRDTTTVGCGVARQGNTEYWACQFRPPGNYSGRKPY